VHNETDRPKAVRLRAELRTDSPHVATSRPRLSWATETRRPAWYQAAAELELDGDPASRYAVEGSSSVLVEWPFDPITSHSTHSVRVRVTGGDGDSSEWSEPLMIFAAFLDDGGWTATWVALASPQRRAQPVLLRREFTVEPGLRRAIVTATAFGAFELKLDGARVGDEEMSPGWTSYRARVLHETADVTAALAPGAHALGVTLAGAWYTETYGPTDDRRVVYGDQPAFALQLDLDYEDGRSVRVVSDGSWRATGDGALVSSGIYDGEYYDARRELGGWSRPGFDDGGWPAAMVVEGPVPEPRTAPPVRRIEERAPIAVLRDPDGAPILDFGQNLVGRLRITVQGEAGRTVTIRHAEVLEGGRLGVRPLRGAAATDRYVLRGDGVEVWEPRFTFHGFRYVQLTGWPGALDPQNVSAVVLHSDMRRTGWFSSSHELLNRLHENVVWGMRGNFLSIPTDCPQRDERLGWTGDIQVFAPTASFLYDSHAFIESWLRDLALEQHAAGGIVPDVIPNALAAYLPQTPAAAWGDAATIVPSVLHQRFADRRLLADRLDSMRDWVDVILRRRDTDGIWRKDRQYGDWLDPTAPPDRPDEAQTSAVIVANAYLYRSVRLTAGAARELGRDADAAHYDEAAHGVGEAFRTAFVRADGRMSSDAETAYALAIVFDLVDPATAREMGDRLAELVTLSGYRVATGFVGTPLVCDALSSTGHLDVAARLLLQTKLPSWLYPVTMGATTIWERWDSMLPDGSINPGEMTSFNHYALGAVADWMHRVVCGLVPLAPGYEVVGVAPNPIQGLDHAEARLETVFGLTSVGWRRDGDVIVVDAEIPPNARAVVRLPGADTDIEVGSGWHRWRASTAPAEAALTREPEEVR